MLRKCTHCGLEAHTKENLVSFVRQARGKHGYRNLCRTCHGTSESYLARYDADYYYDKSLKSKYGITINDYNNMFKEQKGCCKICGEHQDTIKSKLCVDHCHTTGKIRGLLCQYCNSAIGFLKDDTTLLDKVRNYLNN